MRVVVVAIATLLFLSACHVHIEYPGGGDSGNDSAGAAQVGSDSDVAIAWFTAVLTVATLGMWFVMWRTLLATRQSIATQVDAARGKLMLDSATFPQDHIVAPVFKNVGSGNLIVREYAVGASPFALGGTLPDAITDFRKDAGRYGTHVGPGDFFKPVARPWTTHPTGQPFDYTHIIQFQIIYETVGTSVLYHSAWLAIKNNFSGRNVSKALDYEEDATGISMID